MKKILKIGFSLGAVFALCAFAAVPALAADELLLKGATFTGERNTETEGTLKLVNYATAGGSVKLTEITCSGIFDGTVTGGANAKDTVLNVLSSAMAVVGTLETGDTEKTGLNCEATFDEGSTLDCQVGTLATVFVVGINTQLEEWATSEIVLSGTAIIDKIAATNNLGGKLGYDAECTLLDGIKISNECTGETGESTLTNATTTSPPSVLGVFDVSPVASRANCTLTGEHSGELLGEGHLWIIGTELEHLETAVN